MKALLTIAVVMMFFGCNCHYEDCTPDNFGIVFRNYDSADLRQIILRRYDTAGFYVHKLDSGFVGVNYDTAKIGGDAVLAASVIQPWYNWEIVLPALSRTIRIYNIANEHTQIKQCGYEKTLLLCWSPVTSYMQDGILKTTATGDIIDGRAVIIK